MGAILGLQIHLRVPVADKSQKMPQANRCSLPVEKNHNISCGEIDAKSSSTGAEHEEEFLRPWRIVLIDHPRSVVVVCLAIEAAVLVPTPPAVILQDVQHAGHLHCESPACDKTIAIVRVWQSPS